MTVNKQISTHAECGEREQEWNDTPQACGQARNIRGALTKLSEVIVCNIRRSKAQFHLNKWKKCPFLSDSGLFVHPLKISPEASMDSLLSLPRAAARNTPQNTQLDYVTSRSDTCCLK